MIRLPPDKGITKMYSPNHPDDYTKRNHFINDEQTKNDDSKDNTGVITDEGCSREACIHDQTDSIKRDLTGESSKKACELLKPENLLPDSEKSRTKAQNDGITSLLEAKSPELPLIPDSIAISDLLPTKQSPIPLVELPPVVANPPMAKPHSENPYEKMGTVATAIEFLLSLPKTTLSQPTLRFKVTKEAALYNLELLRKNDYNLTKLCNIQDRSSTTYGSEFKNTTVLEKLFYLHPRWHKLRSQLTLGVDFYMQDLDDDMRQKDSGFGTKPYGSGDAYRNQRGRKIFTK